MRAAVIGAGSWGTAYAKVLVDAGNEVTLWARREEVAERIRRDHINADYLPDIELPEALRATHDAAAALEKLGPLAGQDKRPLGAVDQLDPQVLFQVVHHLAGG